MKQYRKIIAILTAVTTGLVMSSEFKSEAADWVLTGDQVKDLGAYKIMQPYAFTEIPEEALLNTKKAVMQAEEKYKAKKRKEEEERKAAEEARRAQEEAERIAAEQAAAEQAAAQQAAAEQAAAEQTAVQEAAAIQQAPVTATASDQTLLAAIIFCEAGNQPYEGQVAVGAVILNRVRSSVYPNSIAEVIYQSGQFGPAMSGWLDSVLASGGYTATAMQAAADALAGSNPIGDCLYFGCGNYGIQIGDHFFH
ncbi:MAG: cell wall hydrolase [Dorea sp.]|nr:cell wall hydrolase [uncultured Schaedlerella sp.]MCI9077056.1 cell wall hydrolase [Dorea sp.]